MGDFEQVFNLYIVDSQTSEKIADFEWKDVETDLPTSSNSLAGSMDVCGHLGDGNLVISGPPTGNRKTLCMQKLPFFWLCFVVIWKILEQ